MLQGLDLLAQTISAGCTAASGPPTRRGGLFSRWRRQPERHELPGTKPWIDKLFRWTAADQLRMGGRSLTFTTHGCGLSVSLDGDTLASMAAEFAPDEIEWATYWDAALGGNAFSIDDSRTLNLPAGAPLPKLTRLPDQIELVWTPPAVVTQGRFRAQLTGVTISCDCAVIHAEWRLLGIDLARDPVVWWAD